MEAKTIKLKPLSVYGTYLRKVHWSSIWRRLSTTLLPTRIPTSITWDWCWVTIKNTSRWLAQTLRTKDLRSISKPGEQIIFTDLSWTHCCRPISTRRSMVLLEAFDSLVIVILSWKNLLITTLIVNKTRNKSSPSGNFSMSILVKKWLKKTISSSVAKVLMMTLP